MENTSRGFHTITIIKKLTKEEAKILWQDFWIYSEKSAEVKMFPLKNNKIPDTADEFIKKLYSSSARYYVIHYKGKGILWLLRIGNRSPGFVKPTEDDRPCSIKATLNPKILSGKKDYLTAATSDYLDETEALFNAEARKISPVLGDYSHFSMSRPDYCVNFDLKELGISCTAEQMMHLIRHGDIPRHYSEWMAYNKKSKRKRPCKDSFYLKCGSATINCYGKNKQLITNHPQCPNLESSRHIIRFEVQCKYPKMYRLSQDIKNRSDVSEAEVIRKMLSDDFCAYIIRDYFDRVIRRGNYFALDWAIQRVQENHYQQKKEERLIHELKRINQRRGIHKVRAELEGDELKTFQRTLRELAAIGINPVTIPREWNIQYIPNLLDAYDKFCDKERTEMDILEDFLQKNIGKRKWKWG